MNPRDRAVRQAQHQMRLASANPICPVCGEANVNRLVLPKGHHITGEQRDPSLQTPICASCHLETHFSYGADGVTLKREGRIQARAASRLRALASFLSLIVDYLRRWADELEVQQ
jgi:hypothetical protein